MSFPNGDQFWLTAAEQTQQHIKHGEKLLAPREFKEQFAQCSDYESSWISDKDYFQWLIIHKGRMSSINLAFCRGSPQEILPSLC